MENSRFSLKMVCVVFVWVWTVYTISVHLSSIDVHALEDSKSVIETPPTWAHISNLYIPGQWQVPAFWSISVGERLVRHFAQQLRKLSRSSSSSPFKLKHVKDLRPKPVDSEKKKAKAKEEPHGCEEEEEEFRILVRKRKKRSMEYLKSVASSARSKRLTHLKIHV